MGGISDKSLGKALAERPEMERHKDIDRREFL